MTPLRFIAVLPSVTIGCIAMLGSPLTIAGTFPECTTPLPCAEDCFDSTPGVGGCTHTECCKSVCAIVAECCTEEWALDCATFAISHPPCQRPKCPPTDLNDDGIVNGVDLAILLGAWGPC